MANDSRNWLRIVEKESVMSLPRWLVVLTVFALLCAVLEGLQDASPAWFVQVCGGLTIACPLLLAFSGLRQRFP